MNRPFDACVGCNGRECNKGRIMKMIKIWWVNSTSLTFDLLAVVYNETFDVSRLVDSLLEDKKDLDGFIVTTDSADISEIRRRNPSCYCGEWHERKTGVTKHRYKGRSDEELDKEALAWLERNVYGSVCGKVQQATGGC